MDQPALTQFSASLAPEQSGTSAGAAWSLSRLTLTSLYFHPHIEVSRARFAVANAAVKAARQIPNPTLSFGNTDDSGRSSTTADVLRLSQMRQQQQITRSYRLGEVDRSAPPTAELQLIIVESSRFDAVVQLREVLAALEDPLQQSLFDAGALYIQEPDAKTLGK